MSQSGQHFRETSSTCPCKQAEEQMGTLQKRVTPSCPQKFTALAPRLFVIVGGCVQGRPTAKHSNILTYSSGCRRRQAGCLFTLEVLQLLNNDRQPGNVHSATFILTFPPFFKPINGKTRTRFYPLLLTLNIIFYCQINRTWMMKFSCSRILKITAGE